MNPITKRVKKANDLQGSAYFLTSLIPFSWPDLLDDDDEEASFTSTTGDVKNPYNIPLKAAPVWVLKHHQKNQIKQTFLHFIV